METYMPVAEASSWVDVPGTISLLVQRIHAKEGAKLWGQPEERKLAA